MVDFDDFDLGPQSDEPSPEECDDSFADAPEHDDSFADNMEMDASEFYGDAEMSRWDDDPSPYDGTYSEE